MDQSTILLTYKRKVLLMRKDFVIDKSEQNFWHFIAGIKDEDQSYEEAIKNVVEEEIGIELNALELISYGPKEFFYHANLTDENVNNIVRAEGKIFDFFSLKELGGLSLTLLTKLLITKHRDLLEKSEAI